MSQRALILKAFRFYRQTRVPHRLGLKKVYIHSLEEDNREETKPVSYCTHPVCARAYTRANTAAATSMTKTELLAD